MRKTVGGLTLAVIGCGALGSEVARLLGLLGVQRVLLVDFDRVESTNATHSSYYRCVHGMGRKKTEVLAEALSIDFPDTRWESIACRVADVGFGLLQGCEFIFSCTDNTAARVETCYVARRLRLPMVDGGIKGQAVWSGRVAWFPVSHAAACYLCQLSEARRAEMLAVPFSCRQSCGASQPDHGTLPSTPTMASIVGALQVDLGIRLAVSEPCNGSDTTARGWEISLPLPGTSWREFEISRSVSCPWHDFEEPGLFVPLATTSSVRESLTQLAEQHNVPSLLLELDWPMCLRAACLECGHHWKPLTRLAMLRNGTTGCPACGAVRLQALQTIERVAPDDAIAELTPEQLGLPANHLFTLSNRAVRNASLGEGDPCALR